METKKRFKWTLTILIVFVALSIALYFLNNYTVPLIEKFLDEPLRFPFDLNVSFVIFYAQWIILAVILILIYFGKMKKKKAPPVQFKAPPKKSEAETDLDILYNTLKINDKITVEDISKKFNISKEKALDWAKILENHDLVDIDYPLFTSPEIKLKLKKQNEDKKEGCEKKPGKGNTREGTDKKGRETSKVPRNGKEKGKPGKKARRKKGNKV
jgi:hypothetical protein